ncbi:TPA: 8-amino-7-oxononanoate synthase [Candidatus Poribacteria bacterium]|jgi:glycine C-acetyltransferase/8-amino-7-oxononanoate synthase|nr:8-amino-7-oxononanoate synthase [Candidatus Poribacteria bacterium]HIB88387.1 8-amino-7-oxononanoate synthase [Candidatus Poribacteria bacterium]HIO45805.1 8-amino-7-oxononanoate synthase [Candidatus Poribacteria bacterium]HIO80810.1 8-amino-7-oxononanoate synthase [Candidatus Poribacteria bacterium]
MDHHSWIKDEIGRLRQNNLWRSLRSVESLPLGRAKIDGREIILLGSNNYLGLSAHPQVIEAAKNALVGFGTGSSGSRLTTGNLNLYAELEEKIAKLKQTEAAIVFSSGYLANIGVISVLAVEGDLILSDQLNHASIIDGCRLSKAEKLIYLHSDLTHLEHLLKDAGRYQRRWIITDGVFSMDGDIAPLPAIYDLACRYGARLIVDDAHGFGVLGRKGSGTVEYFGLSKNRDIIQIGTLSKAVGGLGGYVAASKNLIDLLINQARSFIFSTGLPPATLAAAATAVDIIHSCVETRQKLLGNARKLKNELHQHKFDFLVNETQIIPLIIGSAKRTLHFSEVLFEHGVYAPAIRPPTVPEGTSRLRISVIATHTDDDIRKVIQALIESRTSVDKIYQL